MHEESPWAPRAAPIPPAQDQPEQNELEQNLPEQSAAGVDPAEPGAGIDSSTALGLAVVLLALAGICALLGAHFLLGALRLAAGILAGLGFGAALLALLGALLSARLAPRPRILFAGGTALAVMLVLTVPAVLATRLDPLADQAAVSIDALAEGDTVHSLPAAGTPVLVRRADGSAQLLDDTGARHLEATPGDVLALSADGARLVPATGATTEVLLLDPTASTVDGGFPSQTFDGTPLALTGDVLVQRHCEEGTCRLSGYDLTAPEEPLWTILDAAETHGVDPAGTEVAARPDAPPGLLDAARITGTLPAVPLRFDPAQGWVQLDPASGFAVGRILAGPEEECRIAATGPSPQPQDPLREAPLVLTACSDEDGALTATAFRDGEVLWESAASPAGEWSVRLDQGRVLATGTEAGVETAGEIIASAQRAEWTAPGAEGVAQAEAFSARVGIDGGAMIIANASGQLVAYDTADGANTWTLPLTSPDAVVRGSLGVGTAVVLDPVVREHPLDPRGAQRLRVIEASTGEVTVERIGGQQVEALHPVGGGRALVTVDGESLLLGP